jgi:hypothetical protein
MFYQTEVVSPISMVCGNVLIDFSEPIDLSSMPRLTLTFFVLTMDKTGHIVWPTNFEPPTQAQLRRQARAGRLVRGKAQATATGPR